MVEDMLLPEEAYFIKQIPISYKNSPNKLIWTDSAQGAFSVRSAYHLHLNLVEAEKGQASCSTNQGTFWSSLWKLQVPPADRMFIWRACHEGLPTNKNLYMKKIIDKPCCPICLMVEENVIHAIWNCPASQDVWHQCSRPLQKSSSPKTTILELMQELEDTGGKELVEEFVLVAKRVWMRRNQFIFKQEFKCPNSVALAAKDTLDELRLISTATSNQTSLNQALTTTWSPPPTNFYKLNWDAAVDKAQCKIGIDLIIRDWNGRIVATLRSHRPLFPDPFLAGACGAMEAACFGQQMGLKKIILEGDSKEVISAINSRKNN